MSNMWDLIHKVGVCACGCACCVSEIYLDDTDGVRTVTIWGWHEYILLLTILKLYLLSLSLHCCFC